MTKVTNCNEDEAREGESISISIFNTFYETYKRRITLRAKQLCRKYDVAIYVHEDCVQSAMLSVYRKIKDWNVSQGSLYTYTFLGQRKAMIAIIREYHANKAFSRKPLVHLIGSEGASEVGIERRRSDRQKVSFNEERLVDTIYLNALLQESLTVEPLRTMRFLSYAFDTNCIAQLARESSLPVSKQTYFNNIVYVRKQLRKKARVHCG